MAMGHRGSGIGQERRVRVRGRVVPAALLATCVAMAAACGSSAATPTRSAGAASHPETTTRSLAATKLRLASFGGSFSEPLWVGSPRGDARVFVLERAGRILSVRGGTRKVVLDIRRLVESGGGEQGLLGLAFHPKFATNGRIFVYYTSHAGGDARVVEYHVSGGKARGAKLRLKVGLDSQFQNHNGGGMQFGPDGLLYVGVGDGGSGGDPDNHAQDPNLLMGKLLRIDVDHGLGARQVPAKNHYAGGGGRGEVFAIGLRNPWRFSFDHATGDLWIGDVGQDSFEEVDHLRQPLRNDADFGWRRFEGASSYDASTALAPGMGYVAPSFTYSHSVGCSITGGVVYRGAKIPALRGRYLYADFCQTWLAISSGRGAGSLRETGVGGIASIGEDGAGEVVVASPQTGKVYRLVG